ncbi:uncharacterized protein EI90DRAFT_2905525, partial [Cantharellus anzutake]|uniref:uncharacterized protein n=1 Tax=Cantharellus anzutake TaxID=1750568 RepID=UPI00190315E2
MSLSAEPLSLHSNASQTHLGHYSDPEQQQPHFSSQGFQHHHQSSHSSNSYPPLHGSAAEFGGSADHLPLAHSQTSSPIVVPSQTAPLPVYPSRPSSSSSGAGVGGPGAIGGIQIMHTDDASSKETQFLRRRCHNCHTTEPPSWRRSTLNEGKIVCNKCGLYERTHMRPRPPRFDEVR